jgi:hypothetical protein
MMAYATKSQNAGKNAQTYFRKEQSQEVPLKRSLRAERVQEAAKTAKLRALRLAKEQADKEEAEKLAAAKPTQKQPSRTRTPAKSVKMVRMIY